MDATGILVESCNDKGDDTNVLKLEQGFGDEDVKSLSSASSSESHVENGSSHAGKVEPMLEKETFAVKSSKLVVLFVLTIVAASFGTATYVILASEEDDDFRSAFRASAKEIITLANNRLESTVGAIEDLEVTLTSSAANSESAWPFYTLPDFERRLKQAIDLTGAHMIATAPVLEQSQKAEWEAYARENQGWIREGHVARGEDVDPGVIPEHIYDAWFGEHGSQAADKAERRSVLPLWQMAPAPYNASSILLDLTSMESVRANTQAANATRKTYLSELVEYDYILQREWDHPHSLFYKSFRHSFDQDAKPAGIVVVTLCWNFFFNGLMPDGINGYVVHVKDGCGADFSYRIDGKIETFIGYGSHHDPQYDGLFEQSSFPTATSNVLQHVTTTCGYTLTVYPTPELESSFEDSDPLVYALVVVCAFVITAIVFETYDWAVEWRQRKVMSTAEQTTAIVSSLFPKSVHDRIMQEVQEKIKATENNKKRTKVAPRAQLREFLQNDDDNTGSSAHDIKQSKPIADLFPETTIMFADIVGFTAWSSMREPSQVFTLLETIYHDFDEIAKRRRIFKVETIGDCYVAVAGLPEPRADHAVAMARFARQCLTEVLKRFQELEESLGPDTAELGMRFGLHSGPVTAGVLRGERARFQLFGDSVNTAARMESTGERNRIHISKATADRLAMAGKAHWYRPREKEVEAKGKGKMQTFWLGTKGVSSVSGSIPSSASEEFSENEAVHCNVGPHPDADLGMSEDSPAMSDQYQRLVTWNTDILVKFLKQIVAHREVSGTTPDTEAIVLQAEKASVDDAKGTTVLDEVEDVISLPSFEKQVTKNQRDPNSIVLSDVVLEQLTHYVQSIARLYKANPFHSFAHESQVAMSVCKLLSRIVAPEIVDDVNAGVEKMLHDHTYGITSDPLTQFAVVFSALIHDVDHPGVPNAQLIKETQSMAAFYNNKSIAEQNSVDIAWKLLMQPSYVALRRTIYTTENEFKRFRQLIVNVVMATDIMDKELGDARRKRWNIAFADGNTSLPTHHDGAPEKEVDRNRKATIVIEHLIQASDVAHTMQHWHVYRKWNARLFEEMYKAYKLGRAEKDPSEFWYEGEMKFFDFYIIPLAKKLKDCGVFGVSSDEYLCYALQNRQEWETKGRRIVEELMESLRNERSTCARD